MYSSKPKKPKATAFERAVAALSRRPHSIKALAKKLQRCGYEESEVNAAINRCLELGYLNDADLANRMSRTVVKSKLCSDRLALRHMEENGLNSALAQSSIDAALANNEIPSEIDRARMALRKKFREVDPDKIPREKAVRFLASRGFDWDLIASVLACDSLE